MIVSASRRTDIPAWYPEWLVNRVREGFVLVRNPMNPHQVSRISLSPDVVDGFVFWTKNPGPMLRHLDVFADYPYYFQCTITPCGTDVEPNLPPKGREIIPAFQRLSDKIGPRRMIWRYDPILLSDRYTPEYHMEFFEEMARRLKGYARKCTISFLDMYRCTAQNTRPLALKEISEQDMRRTARALSGIAAEYGLAVDTCAEEIELSEFGIGHARCVDGAIFEEITGGALDLQKDPNQRKACGCAVSVDIGAYNSCGNGCLYCYANQSPAGALRNMQGHRPDSPLLIGEIGEGDTVRDRPMKACGRTQIGMFD